jgi:hypothetical protein
MLKLSVLCEHIGFFSQAREAEETEKARKEEEKEKADKRENWLGSKTVSTLDWHIFFIP